MIVKTRAWNKKVGEMVYSHADMEIMSGMGNPDLLVYNPTHVRKSEFSDYEFMLSTGVLDKNGHEIYEGDIVEGFGVVYWDKDNVHFGFIDLEKGYEHEFNYLMSPKVVIGNIYENVEQYEATPYFIARSQANEIIDKLKADPDLGYWVDFSSEVSLWRYNPEAGLMHKRMFGGGSERDWTTFATSLQAEYSLMGVLQRAFDLADGFKKYVQIA